MDAGCGTMLHPVITNEAAMMENEIAHANRHAVRRWSVDERAGIPTGFGPVL